MKPSIDLAAAPSRLRAWRRFLRLTQAQLCKDLGVSRPTYGRWEADPAVLTLDALSRACARMGVTLEKLLGPTPEEEYAQRAREARLRAGAEP